MDTACPKSGEWFDIPDCEALRASVDGEILDTRTGKLKRQSRAPNGAMKVNVGGSTRMVHDLVASAVYGRPFGPGYRIKQLNGDLSDNRAENLAWFGRPTSQDQVPQLNIILEQAYEKARLDRLALIELMQS